MCNFSINGNLKNILVELHKKINSVLLLIVYGYEFNDNLLTLSNNAVIIVMLENKVKAFRIF